MATKKKTKEEKIVITRGKKKRAVARARVKNGLKSLKVNGKSVESLNPSIVKDIITEPIELARNVLGEGFDNNLDIDVNVYGGGIMGQAFATRTAIGKALLKWTESEELKNMFSEYDTTLVKEDVRKKEPKKYLRKGARARPTTSYR